MIPAHSLVTCPNGHGIARTKVDSHPCQIIDARDFAFFPGQERLPLEEARCSLCDAPYIDGGEIHIDGEWRRE